MFGALLCSSDKEKAISRRRFSSQQDCFLEENEESPSCTVNQLSLKSLKKELCQYMQIKRRSKLIWLGEMGLNSITRDENRKTKAVQSTGQLGMIAPNQDLFKKKKQQVNMSSFHIEQSQIPEQV